MQDSSQQSVLQKHGTKQYYTNVHVHSEKTMLFAKTLINTIIILEYACRCSQTLARSSREMSQTVRINCRSILSRVRISVRPSNFFVGENQKNVYLRGVTN